MGFRASEAPDPNPAPTVVWSLTSIVKASVTDSKPTVQAYFSPSPPPWRIYFTWPHPAALSCYLFCAVSCPYILAAVVFVLFLIPLSDCFLMFISCSTLPSLNFHFIWASFETFSIRTSHVSLVYFLPFCVPCPVFSLVTRHIGGPETNFLLKCFRPQAGLCGIFRHWSVKPLGYFIRSNV